MSTLLLDLRLAGRSLLRAPGFTAVAVATLALGIGFNTALFSLLHGVLLQPLPYPHGERVAVIWNELGEGGAQSLPAVSIADFLDYRQMTESFEEFAAATGARMVGLNGILTDGDVPEKVDLSPVTANFFSLFGVEPLHGRAFTAEEEAYQGPRSAILSYQLWQRRYGGDEGLLGRSIEIDGLTHEVVGILPEDFRLLLPAEAFMLKHSDVWTPLAVDTSNLPDRNFTSLSVFGRLRPGVTFAQAQDEMTALATKFQEIYPVHTASQLKIRVVPLQEDVVKATRPALMILMGAVAFVLLIVCANVGSLLLVRGAARQRELAVQAALGAGFGRLLRRLLAESLLLALLGGVGAVLVAEAGLAALRTLRPVDLPRLAEVQIDGAVLAFTAAIALVTVLLFGLVPAIQGARAKATGALRSSGRASGSRSQNRLRAALVVGEVAISLVLLVGVGLLVQSFGALAKVDPGFDPQGVLTFRVELPRADYPSREERQAFFDLLERNLAGLPGVTSVGGISQLPLSGSGPLHPYAYDERTARAWESVTADGRWITPGYFETMGIQILSGRSFDEADRQRTGELPILLIDEVVAGKAFPGQDPVGRRLQIGPNGSENLYGEVIGLVEHVRSHDLSQEILGQIYRPGWFGNQKTIVVKTTGDPQALLRSAEALVKEQDPGLPVIDAKPMAAYVDDALGHARFSLMLMSLFGALALVLVAIGIYGVISYGTRLRLKEFAIRLALGEAPRRLALRVVRQGALLAAGAALLGLAAAWLLSRQLQEVLYQVDARDPLTLAGAALVLIAVAVAASLLPALRAGRVQPASLLRQE